MSAVMSRECVDHDGTAYRLRIDLGWIEPGAQLEVLKEGCDPGDKIVKYGDDPWILVGDVGTVGEVHAGYDDGPNAVGESWATLVLDSGAHIAIYPSGQDSKWRLSTQEKKS